MITKPEGTVVLGERTVAQGSKDACNAAMALIGDGAKLNIRWASSCECADRIVAMYDDMFLEDRFDEADALLRECDVDDIDVDEMLAILVITLSAADKLPSRAGFFNRSRDRLVALFPQARVERLLKRLDKK